LSRKLTINSAQNLRTVRGLAVVFLMLVYAFGGLVHSLTDVGFFVSPAQTVMLSASDTSDGHSDKGGLAEDHCHGCFSVTIAAPPLVAAAIKQGAATIAPPQLGFPDSMPELDTPPPKFLT
jgi:hypothetical protein